MKVALPLLYTVKLFIAAMISFVIADKIGLPNPYWCIVTCCVVMNPLTGTLRSKAVYRFVGTACGGIVALVLAVLFASIPLLLVVVSGLVAAVAFACSVLDRTPRSYGYGLLGITLMLVAVPGATHAAAMFDTAVARVCEIGLGIIVTTIVDSLIAPRSLGPTLRRRLQGWLPDVAAWMNDALSGRLVDVQAEHDRLKIIVDITALSVLTGQLRYDPMVSPRELQLALAIQQRLLRLIPAISAIGARIAHATPAERAIIDPLLEEAQARLGDAAYDPAELLVRLRQLPVADDEQAHWHRLVRDTLADLVADAMRLWGEVRRLDAALHDGRALEPTFERQAQRAAAFPLVPDWSLALRLAGGILVSYVILCSLWWATGWSQGPGAVLLGTVALAFFGAGDDPRPIIAKFGSFVLVAYVAVGILCYGLLPLAHDFPTFMIAMGIFMLPLGFWAASNPMALLLLAMGLSSINLQGFYNPYDFGFYLESMFGSLVGIYVAFFCCNLFRTLGPAHALIHLAGRERADVIRLSRQASPYARDAYIQRALDRIAAMVLRFKVGDVDQSARLLIQLRAGVSVANLRMTSATLSGDVRDASDDLLSGIRRDIDTNSPPRILPLIDHALSTVWRAAPHPAHHDLLRSLTGLRLALFGSAPAWQPAT